MYLILLILTIIILGFNYWGFFMFEGFKFWSFWVGIWFVLLILFFKRRQGRLKRILKYFESLKFWSIDFLLMVYLLVLSLATFTALNFKVSFWGLENRYQGLFVWIHYVLFFFLVKYFYKKDKLSFLKISYFFVGITTVVSIYAIVQRLGVDLPNLYQIFTVSRENPLIRSFSTLGHPNYLGIYLAMVLPFFYYLFVKVSAKGGATYGRKSYKACPESNRRVKGLIWLSFILASLSLLFTLNRGGWLAALGMSIFFFLVLFFKKKQLSLKLIVKLSLIIIFFSSFFWGSFWGNGVSERTELMFSDKVSSMTIRLNEYKFAWQKIKEKPVLGYGLDNYIFVSQERYRSPEELFRDARPMDRVHNLFLDILIRSGVLGLGVFLLIIIKTVHLFCSDWGKESEVFLKKLVLFSVLLAYLIAIQFHFETVSSSVLMFFVLALIDS